MGYLVLAFGFSLEFGGRDAFVDEAARWGFKPVELDARVLLEA